MEKHQLFSLKKTEEKQLLLIMGPRGIVRGGQMPLPNQRQ